MTGKPKRIEGAKLQLKNGDELPVVAFRRGPRRYVLAYEDGSPLAVDLSEIAGYTIPMLPGRSSVELSFQEGE